MTLTCLNIVLAKSLEGVLLTTKLGVSYHSVMTNHVGGISAGER